MKSVGIIFYIVLIFHNLSVKSVENFRKYVYKNYNTGVSCYNCFKRKLII